MKRIDTRTAVMTTVVLLLLSMWSLHAKATMVRDNFTAGFQVKGTDSRHVSEKQDPRQQNGKERNLLSAVIEGSSWYRTEKGDYGQFAVDVDSDDILLRFAPVYDGWHTNRRDDWNIRSWSRANNERRVSENISKGRGKSISDWQEHEEGHAIWDADHSGSTRFFEDHDDDRFDFYHDGHGHHHHGSWDGHDQVPGVPIPGALIMLMSSLLALGALGRKRG